MISEAYMAEVVQVNASMSEEVRNRLLRLCAEDERSISEQVRWLINREAARREAGGGQISLEGLRSEALAWHSRAFQLESALRAIVENPGSAVWLAAQALNNHTAPTGEASADAVLIE
jgi:hypothetical protein